eukprot:CAMPEP_0202956282 /NCGR_PEP_ID=MMETSP1396-20130829/782_1 /ASSEMBLY_ACC=CAM_ASM_000872 /TAXON_ID= /ORGANISM="Pseudokeronopsis sp., Strain Brazil" /LENGTH=137 /DNA_ID=CAMNT_0049673215 /DNA_START=75 /DNA_END=488 /DNA_ORIENTATION=-
MYGREFIDAPANLQRVDTHEDSELFGGISISEVLDYSAQKLFLAFHEEHLCQVFDFPYDVDLMELMAQVRDPESGLVKYNGQVAVSWTDEVYHKFTLSQPEELGIDEEEMLYTDEEGRVLWAEIPSKGWVLEISEGF